VECTCYANYYGNVVFCPKHLACDDMYEACCHAKLVLIRRLCDGYSLSKQEELLHIELDKVFAKVEVAR